VALDAGQARREPVDEGPPLLAVAREDADAGAHVGGPLRVVRRAGRHGGRPALGHVGAPGVEGVRGEAPDHGRADLALRHQLVPAVVGGILDALRLDRPAHLLEPDDQFVAQVALAASGGPHLAPEHQVDDDVQSVAQFRVEARGRHLGGLLDDLHGRRGRLLAGDDVGAVAGERDDELGDAVADPPERVVAQHDVVAADLVGERRDAMHLGEQRRGGDLALGVGDDLRQRARDVAGELKGKAGQRRLPGRVELQGVDAPGGVVAGGARDRPVVGGCLVALEDFLGHHPGAPGGGGEAAQVAARVGETVGMVDAEGVDVPGVVQLQQQGVGGVEDVRVLDAHGDEGVDVEEAPEVELLVGDLPVGQAVVLRLDALGQGKVLRAGAHREDVVEVAQDGLRAGVLLARDDLGGGGQFAAGEDGADPGAEDGQQDAVGGVGAVEPGGVLGARTFLEHGPQRPVVPQRGRHGHVVGDDVDDHAQAARVSCRGQLLEGGAPAHHLGDPGVVDHVVAVGGAGGGRQDGREVEVGDAEGVQVGQLSPRLVERQIRTELEAVRVDRRPAALRGQVRTGGRAGSHGGRPFLS